MQASLKATPLKLTIALLIVYLAWGSSYAAIKYGVHDVQPLEFSGLRFLLLAPIMWAISHRRGVSAPIARRDWFLLTISSLVMLVVASGLIAWSQQWVPSGQAALLMSTSALWMLVFGAIGSAPGSVRSREVIGLLVGLPGVAFLIGSGLQTQAAPWFAYAGVMGSAMAWSAGTMLLRRCPVRTDPTMTIAIQSLIGGLALFGLSRFSPTQSIWSTSAQLALLYLLLVGSVAGYWAYYWLIERVSPALLGTYAYANPLVATGLGFIFLGERMSALQMLGAALILLSLLVVGVSRAR